MGWEWEQDDGAEEDELPVGDEKRRPAKNQNSDGGC
jgi:hypothetical protein